jgi:hypothetical protein
VKGHVRRQAPSQKCDNSVTEVQKALLLGAGSQVPGTVTKLQRKGVEP